MPRSLRPLAHLWGRIGLRGRILLAFVLLMTVTALAYAWAVIRVVEFTEEELMTRGMTDESVRVEQVLARGRTPKLQDGWALYLDPVPGPAGDRWRETTVPPMPEAFREAHDGFSELLDPPAFLYKRTVVAGVIAVTLDQARFEAQEIWIMRFTWASVFVVLAVSLVVGGAFGRGGVVADRAAQLGRAPTGGCEEVRPLGGRRLERRSGAVGAPLRPRDAGALRGFGPREGLHRGREP